MTHDDSTTVIKKLQSINLKIQERIEDYTDVGAFEKSYSYFLNANYDDPYYDDGIRFRITPRPELYDEVFFHFDIINLSDLIKETVTEKEIFIISNSNNSSIIEEFIKQIRQLQRIGLESKYDTFSDIYYVQIINYRKKSKIINPRIDLYTNEIETKLFALIENKTKLAIHKKLKCDILKQEISRLRTQARQLTFENNKTKSQAKEKIAFIQQQIIPLREQLKHYLEVEPNETSLNTSNQSNNKQQKDSFKLIERVSFLRYIYHDWFGFRCSVNSATLYSNNGDKPHIFTYKDCYLTLSRNILSLKDDKGFIWKIKIRLLELKEGEKASIITFVDQNNQKYSLRSDKGKGFSVSIFEFTPHKTPLVSLSLNSTAFNDKVFNYFRMNGENLKPNSKEVLLSALYEAESILNNDSFGLVKIHFEKAIQKDADKILNWIKEYNSSPLSWIYSKTSNISGDMVESGEYHIYRNALNETGQNLLKLFDDSTDRLCEQGDIKKDYADSQKTNIREYIKGIG